MRIDRDSLIRDLPPKSSQYSTLWSVSGMLLYVTNGEITMITIQDAKSELERTIGSAVEPYLPQTMGYDTEVDIIENHRKKRSDASRDSWRPEMGEIRIRFTVRPKLNRRHHEDDRSSFGDFAPIEIRGPSLSSTVIQERR